MGKLILSFFWLIFTFSMVSWWWIFSLRQLDILASEIAEEKYGRLRWMLFWEGSFLLAFIFVGGTALLVLTSRERSRNLRLRLFFSNFSHDLKTSLSRLRIRTEVLAQSTNSVAAQELLEEASRLDLQLENSLWMARGEEQNLHLRELSLGEMIGQLRVEWPDMEIHLQRNAKILADLTAIRSIVRNLLQNAWLHGEATRMDIFVSSEGESVVMSFQDNGKGFTGDLSGLGNGALPKFEKQGNGIGLYLSRFLVQKMKGTLIFEKSNSGFKASLKLRGNLV